MPSYVRSINFADAGQLRLPLFVLDCFAEFVHQNKGALVLAVQIARELQRAIALRAVDEDCDGQEVITDGTLAVREDRASSYGELVFATAAFPDRARLEPKDLHAAAFWAIGLTVIVGPTYTPESDARLLISHAGHRAQTERFGFA